MSDAGSVISSDPFTIRDKFNNQYSTQSFKISCKSDKLLDPQDSYAGLALWAWRGKGTWRCNGFKCRTGYIYIRSTTTEDFQCIDSRKEQVHGKLYKALFGEDYDEDDIFATGFSYFEGEWRFRSSLNTLRSCSRGRGISSVQSLEILKAIMCWTCTGRDVCGVPLALSEIHSYIDILPRHKRGFFSFPALRRICESLLRDDMKSVACRVVAAGLKGEKWKQVLASWGLHEEGWRLFCRSLSKNNALRFCMERTAGRAWNLFHVIKDLDVEDSSSKSPKLKKDSWLARMVVFNLQVLDAARLVLEFGEE